MTLTVILPSHNRRRLLALAIASLLRQADDPAAPLPQPLDLLVIDDGSTDDTAALLAELSARDGRIRYRRQSQAGVSAARNAGLAALLPETEVVSFLDSDDLSPPGRLAADLAPLLADPGLDLTYGRMMLVDQLDDQTLVPAPAAHCLTMTGIQLSAGLYRRRLLERIGGFDPSLQQAEDTDYLLRIFESGCRWLQTDTVCLYYRRHGQSLSANSAVARRWFAAALHRSLQRRRHNPALQLQRPTFGIQPLSAIPLPP
jgi:glycosyltransferase involved in cell wall biosynthesis